jgi:hypothetical protein
MHSVPRNREKYIERGERERTGGEREREGGRCREREMESEGERESNIIPSP